MTSPIRCDKWFLCRLVAAILTFLKRTLFSRFRRRRKSDSDLPTVASKLISPVQSTPSNSITAQDLSLREDSADWDDWDYSGAPTGIIIEPTEPYTSPNSTQSVGVPNSPAAGGEDMPEMDYFSDMTPTLKRTVLIRKKDRSRAGLPNSGVPSRLTMSIDNTPVASSELSTWDDNSVGTWEDETGEMDLTWDADRVIKEKKQAERDRRSAEQHRKKLERDAQRAVKKDTGKLAVKLT